MKPGVTTKFDYKVAVKPDGRIFAMKILIDIDVGSDNPFAQEITDRITLASCNYYKTENLYIYTKTHTSRMPPTTISIKVADSQSFFAIENEIQTISNRINLLPDEIRLLNANIQESNKTEKKSSKKMLPFIIPIAIFVILVTTISIMLLTKKKDNNDSEVVVSANSKVNQYEIDKTKFVKRVYKGDQLLLPAQGDGKIILTVRDTLSSFGIDTPSGIFYVDLAEESELDIDGDNVSDMIIYVSDISSTDEKRGAEISVFLRQGTNRDVMATEIKDIPNASEIKTKRPYKVILEDNRAYPFTLNASFRGPCLFRDKVDNANSVETYFNRGEVFTATARNGIRLWISNNNTVKMTIIADSRSFDLDIGVAGQIMVEDIKWIKDTDGKYKLVVIELD